MTDLERFIAAYAQPGDRSIIDPIHPRTGLGVYSGETLEQVRLRYPRAEIVNLEQWQTEKAAMQDRPVTWDECDADEYDRMLEVLPPATMKGGLFAVGEPSDHHALSGEPRYEVYRRTVGGGFERASRPMAIAELRGGVQS